jgi:hypothetical protein
VGTEIKMTHFINGSAFLTTLNAAKTRQDVYKMYDTSYTGPCDCTEGTITIGDDWTIHIITSCRDNTCLIWTSLHEDYYHIEISGDLLYRLLDNKGETENHRSGRTFLLQPEDYEWINQV